MDMDFSFTTSPAAAAAPPPASSVPTPMSLPGRAHAYRSLLARCKDRLLSEEATTTKSDILRDLFPVVRQCPVLVLAQQLTQEELDEGSMLLVLCTLNVEHEVLRQSLKQHLLPPKHRILSIEAPLLWWMLKTNDDTTSDAAATVLWHSTLGLLTLPKYVSTLLRRPPPQHHQQRLSKRLKTDRLASTNDSTTALMYALGHLAYAAASSSHNDTTDTTTTIMVPKLYETWLKIITYFPMMDDGCSETAMALFLWDLLTNSSNSSSSSNNNVVHGLDVNWVVQETLRCGFAALEAFGEIAQLSMDAVVALFVSKLIRNVNIRQSDGTIYDHVNRLLLHFRGRIQIPRAHGTAVQVLAAASSSSSSRKRSFDPTTMTSDDDATEDFRVTVQSLAYPILVHVEALLAQSRYEDAVILASQLEEADPRTAQKAYDRTFEYLVTMATPFYDRSQHWMKSLVSSFVPCAGAVGMRSYANLYRNLHDIVTSERVGVVERTYLQRACRKTLLHLMIVKYDMKEGLKRYHTYFEVDPLSQSAQVAWAERFLKHDNPVPESLRDVEDCGRLGVGKLDALIQRIREPLLPLLLEETPRVAAAAAAAAAAPQQAIDVVDDESEEEVEPNTEDVEPVDRDPHELDEGEPVRDVRREYEIDVDGSTEDDDRQAESLDEEEDSEDKGSETRQRFVESIDGSESAEEAVSVEESVDGQRREDGSVEEDRSVEESEGGAVAEDSMDDDRSADQSDSENPSEEDSIVSDDDEAQHQFFVPPGGGTHDPVNIGSSEDEESTSGHDQGDADTSTDEDSGRNGSFSRPDAHHGQRGSPSASDQGEDESSVDETSIARAMLGVSNQDPATARPLHRVAGIAVRFQANSADVEHGYDAEDSQGHTEEEDNGRVAFQGSSPDVERGYEAGDSRGHTEEEDEPQTISVIDRQHATSMQDGEPLPQPPAALLLASAQLDPGYDGEDSQDHTEEEEIPIEIVQASDSFVNAEDGYDAEDSQGHTEEEEGDVQSEDGSAIEHELSNLHAASGDDVLLMPAPAPVDQVGDQTLSDMSAADERTGEESMAETYEGDEAAESRHLHFPTSRAHARDSDGPRSTLQDHAAAAQRELPTTQRISLTSSFPADDSSVESDAAVAENHSLSASLESLAGNADASVSSLVGAGVVDHVPSDVVPKGVGHNETSRHPVAQQGWDGSQVDAAAAERSASPSNSVSGQLEQGEVPNAPPSASPARISSVRGTTEASKRSPADQGRGGPESDQTGRPPSFPIADLRSTASIDGRQPASRAGMSALDQPGSRASGRGRLKVMPSGESSEQSSSEEESDIEDGSTSPDSAPPPEERQQPGGRQPGIPARTRSVSSEGLRGPQVPVGSPSGSSQVSVGSRLVSQRGRTGSLGGGTAASPGRSARIAEVSSSSARRSPWRGMHTSQNEKKEPLAHTGTEIEGDDPGDTSIPIRGSRLAGGASGVMAVDREELEISGASESPTGKRKVPPVGRQTTRSYGSAETDLTLQQGTDEAGTEGRPTGAQTRTMANSVGLRPIEEAYESEDSAEEESEDAQFDEREKKREQKEAVALQVSVGSRLVSQRGRTGSLGGGTAASPGRSARIADVSSSSARRSPWRGRRTSQNEKESLTHTGTEIKGDDPGDTSIPIRGSRLAEGASGVLAVDREESEISGASESPTGKRKVPPVGRQTTRSYGSAETDLTLQQGADEAGTERRPTGAQTRTMANSVGLRPIEEACESEDSAEEESEDAQFDEREKKREQKEAVALRRSERGQSTLSRRPTPSAASVGDKRDLNDSTNQGNGKAQGDEPEEVVPLRRSERGQSTPSRRPTPSAASVGDKRDLNDSTNQGNENAQGDEPEEVVPMRRSERGQSTPSRRPTRSAASVGDKRDLNDSMDEGNEKAQGDEPEEVVPMRRSERGQSTPSRRPTRSAASVGDKRDLNDSADEGNEKAQGDEPEEVVPMRRSELGQSTPSRRTTRSAASVGDKSYLADNGNEKTQGDEPEKFVPMRRSRHGQSTPSQRTTRSAASGGEKRDLNDSVDEGSEKVKGDEPEEVVPMRRSRHGQSTPSQRTTRSAASGGDTRDSDDLAEEGSEQRYESKPDEVAASGGSRATNPRRATRSTSSVNDMSVSEGASQRPSSRTSSARGRTTPARPPRAASTPQTTPSRPPRATSGPQLRSARPRADSNASSATSRHSRETPSVPSGAGSTSRKASRRQTGKGL